MIWFKFYTAWGEGMTELSDTEAGRFVKALCNYAEGKDIPALSGNERVLFAMARKQIEQDKAKSEKTSSVRSEAGRIGGINSSKQKQAIVSNCLNEEANASDVKQNEANAFNKNKELRIKNQEEELRDIGVSATQKTQTPAKPTKHRHGNFGHVMLTDDELRKLQERFPADNAQGRIQNLDDYLENNRSKHYANHYLTITKWAEKDAQQQPVQPKLIHPEPYKSTYQRLKEMGEI